MRCKSASSLAILSPLHYKLFTLSPSLFRNFNPTLFLLRRYDCTRTLLIYVLSSWTRKYLLSSIFDILLEPMNLDHSKGRPDSQRQPGTLVITESANMMSDGFEWTHVLFGFKEVFRRISQNCLLTDFCDTDLALSRMTGGAFYHEWRGYL